MRCIGSNWRRRDGYRLFHFLYEIEEISKTDYRRVATEAFGETKDIVLRDKFS